METLFPRHSAGLAAIAHPGCLGKSVELKTSLDNKGSRKIDGGNTSQCDEWAGPEQQVTDMQMQDWQGRKMVRLQQMDGDAQSSSGTSTWLPHTTLSAWHQRLPSHLQGTASHPRGSLHWTQTRAGPGEWQQAVCEEDVTQPQLGSQGLTAELLSPACKHIPTLSLVALAPE